MSAQVAVTGVGPVSALGIGRADYLAGLEKGAQAGGADVPLQGFRVEDYLESQKGYLDRASGFLFAAAALSLEDAGLDPASANRTRFATAAGSVHGCLSTMRAFFQDVAAKGPRFAKPVLFPHAYHNTPLSLLCIEYGLRGPSSHFSSGPEAGLQAIAWAAEQIALGRADLALAGGFEALCGLALTDGPAGEGAAMLVLESPEHARGRGAAVHAVLEPSAAGEGGDAAPDTLDVRAPAGPRTLRLRELLGDTGGASGPLAAAAGVLLLPAGGSALVGRPGSFGGLVLRAP